MHAYIIAGGTTKRRSEHIKTLLVARSVSHFDVIAITPDPTSISVESIRSVIVRVSIHPVASPYHAIIIHDAHAMTLEAQNAFLKTLEEPPGDALIILETGMPDALLPTILSRCHLVNLGDDSSYTNEQLSACLQTIDSIMKASSGKRLQIIDTLAKTRDDTLVFVNLAIEALHPKLPSNNVTKLLRSLLTARTHILGNITPKLALDAAFLS